MEYCELLSKFGVDKKLFDKIVDLIISNSILKTSK